MGTKNSHIADGIIKRVGERLAAYSVCAGVAISLAPQSEAAIVTNYPGGGSTWLDVNSGTSQAIDIDGDMNDDFSFYYTLSGGTYFMKMKRLGSENSFGGTTIGIYTYVNKLSGTTTTLGGSSIGNSTGILALCNSMGTWTGNGQWNCVGCESGMETTGFINVKFKIGSNYHYGWIDYEQTWYTGGSMAGKIRGWAYENTPDTPLGAGENAPTLVEIAFVRATGLGNRVVVAWETTSEIGTAGFHLWRSEKEGGGYTRITDALIPAKGGPALEARYIRMDRDVETGKTYYYILEEIEYTGSSRLNDPVPVIAVKRPASSVTH
ncbi:MAG: hypothetical protein SV775_05190 [Thermodesulfobacteriota bacterium]|nr:hypothetical protein [Thermodesulfobacteriota bacterium]